MRSRRGRGPRSGAARVRGQRHRSPKGCGASARAPGPPREHPAGCRTGPTRYGAPGGWSHAPRGVRPRRSSASRGPALEPLTPLHGPRHEVRRLVPRGRRLFAPRAGADRGRAAACAARRPVRDGQDDRRIVPGSNARRARRCRGRPRGGRRAAPTPSRGAHRAPSRRRSACGSLCTRCPSRRAGAPAARSRAAARALAAFHGRDRESRRATVVARARCVR